MVRVVVRRFGALLMVLLSVSTAAFIVLRLTGDPVQMMLPPEQTTPEQIVRLRHQLGLDRPVWVQYLRFLGGLASGDLGESYRYGTPVMPLITERIPATLELAGAAVAFAVVVGVPLGVLSAVKKDRAPDVLASGVSFLGVSVPVFWLGPMLILFFAVRLHWFPTSGIGGWRPLVMPAITLGIYPLAQLARLARSEMLDVLGEDFIRTARSKGLSEPGVIVRHALRKASLSIVTLVGLNIGVLLGGAIITETIFAWPGLGRLIVQAISFRDFPLAEGAVVYISFITVLANFAVDLSYAFLDPRVRAA
ncbi:MAG TPA: ABC transporter permease [Tepidiformaceae bacterium]|nr:ABC transporter permease [Tepidiformaceae bacterium]